MPRMAESVRKKLREFSWEILLLQRSSTAGKYRYYERGPRETS